MTDLDGQERERFDASTRRHVEEGAAHAMTGAVGELGRAGNLMRAMDKQAWAAEIDRVCAEAKRIRDEMYREQGAITESHRTRIYLKTPIPRPDEARKIYEGEL